MANDLSPDVGFGSDIDDVCQEIEDATKGWGANKQKVIDALATKDATERTKISLRYKELHGKKLVDLMKKEFSGDFGTCLEFLALPPDEMECAMIRKACKGVGSHAKVLYSILCGRTNDEMERIKKTYFKIYDKDLGKLLGKELMGGMERLIFNCLQAGEEKYDPQYHTQAKAVEDAEFIHDKGQGRWGTDERSIFKVLAASPREHLENINKIYADKYGYALAKAMQKELGSMTEQNVRNACLHLINMKLKPYETMAATIKDACAGLGTDELLLTCCVVRYQSVMQPVMTAHIELYGKTVHDRVRSECGGKYKELLLQVLETAWPEQG